MIEFKQGKKTFIYDFNKLCGSQMIMAHEAFVIAGQKLKKEPNNLSEMESIISYTSLFKAYGILLLELDESGETIPFVEGAEKGINFLKNMTAANMVKVYSGTLKTVEAEDDDGKPVLDKDGKPITTEIQDCEGVQKDFFIRLGRPSPESQRLYKDSMELVKAQRSGLDLNLKDTTKAVENLVKIVKEKAESSTKTKQKTE